MKATEITDMTINNTHCDYIMEQAKELKALFSYRSDGIIKANKIRALADIQAIQNSINELKAYVENL